MNIKYTPGPWKRNTDGFLENLQGTEVVFSRKHQFIIGDSTPETEANAFLAEASLDLLETLEATQKYICDHHCARYESSHPIQHLTICVCATTAIAKARGEEGK